LIFTSETIKKISIIASWGLFFAFLIFIEIEIGWMKLVSSWLTLSASQLFFAILLILSTYLLRALRFFDYFDMGKEDKLLKWSSMIRLTLLHNVLNNFLPARTGEISFPVLMKKYFSIPYRHSLPALLWFRLLDLHTLLSIALVPFLLHFMPLPIAIIMLSVLLLLPIGVYNLKNRLSISLSTENASHSKWREKLQMLLEGLPCSYQAFFRSWLLTVANWLLKLAILLWILLQFLTIPYSVALEAVIAGELSSVLPFHAPAGVGTYEAGIVTVIMSAQLMIAEAKALMMPVSFEMATSAAVNVHLFLLGASVLGGFLALTLPVKKKSEVAPI
jgi:hypothetical protein